MKDIENNFLDKLRQNKDKKHLELIIKDLVFNLSHESLSGNKTLVKKLYNTFFNILKSENLADEKYILAMVDGLIKSISHDKEKRLHDKIYEKEKLEKLIEQEAKQIQKDIKSSFEELETICDNDEHRKMLQDAKLKGVHLLGILKEVVQETLLTAIENGKDIQESIKVLTRYFTYESILLGDIKKYRVLNIQKSILEVAIELADYNHVYAKEILKGTIFGLQSGMLKAVENIKNDLKFSLDEKEYQESMCKTMKKEVAHLQDDFIDLLKKYTKNKTLKSAKVIKKILEKELDTPAAKMKRVSSEAKELLDERFEQLRKNTNESLEYFKQNATDFEEVAQKKLENIKHNLEELEKITSQKIQYIKENETTKQAKLEIKKLGDRAWEIISNAKNILKTTDAKE